MIKRQIGRVGKLSRYIGLDDATATAKRQKNFKSSETILVANLTHVEQFPASVRGEGSCAAPCIADGADVGNTVGEALLRSPEEVKVNSGGGACARPLEAR